MFDKSLIESSGEQKGQGGWKTTLVSLVLHALVVGGIFAAGYYVKENPEVLDKPIEAFVVAAAPPPPPPPPPPPASSSASQPRTPRTEPVDVTPQPFRTPTDIPQNIPDVDVPQSDGPPQEGGVVGGVEGGVAGGVVGGVVGGVLGGELGGQLGGELGGTGDRPVRVGGDVMAPTVVTRIDPVYTEIARKARISGIVILEAIINTDGNVRDVRVLKPLPMGLDQSALDAVRRWKFKPGTLNGRPVPVIFNLTVNFRLQT